MRHAFFDNVLNQKKTVEHVLEHLADANFDPEFYKLHESEIVAKFNKENNTNILKDNQKIKSKNDFDKNSIDEKAKQFADFFSGEIVNLE